MAAWLTYAKERFPAGVYALLAGGIAASGARLAAPERVAAPALALALALALVGNLLFFFTLRLMDELKDYEKDLVAHPERPLPRGVLTPAAVARAIRVLTAAMAGLAGLAAIVAGPCAGICYLVVTSYLWLMYKEFYVGAWLARSQLLYAVSHQVILLPLCWFGALAAHPEALRATDVRGWGVSVLGSFFTYEVCRKLDPAAHPLLRTYLAVYGRWRTWAIVLATTAVAMHGAALLGASAWLAPVAAAVPLSFGLVLVAPERFKVVESVATLSLLVHLYAGVIAVALRG